MVPWSAGGIVHNHGYFPGIPQITYTNSSQKPERTMVTMVIDPGLVGGLEHVYTCVYDFPFSWEWNVIIPNGRTIQVSEIL